MANSKKRRKIIIFSVAGVVLVGLTVGAIVRKREPVITIQTEKVTRRDLIEKVVANGKIQPVLQVKISPEVSGEIIDLPVKEGQAVKKGDLIVKIKPDFYIAQLHQSEAGYEAAVAGQAQAQANLEKAQADFKRNKDLFEHKLISEADFVGFKAAYDVAAAQVESALHQMESSKATVASIQDSLDKTTIAAPLTGTISKLNSRLGERVLGTVQNVGTEIMTIADLNEMEARVDIGENDVVLIKAGQKTRLEVDAFKDRKFNGVVTEIANSSNDSGLQTQSTTSQEATKFQVRIRIQEKEEFRPGMSVTAEIETRYRTNVLTVPIASVTTRLPKEKDKKGDPKSAALDPPGTNATASKTKSPTPGTNTLAAATNSPGTDGTNGAASDRKSKEGPKPIEVVFVMDGDHAKMAPVKIGISNDDYWEITDGVGEGQEVVSGGYRAISRDLEDGKKIRKGPPPGEKEKQKEEEEAKANK
ncbi:MAG TPA: efflux RND transporter periplasmic adaptor subunit [Candidatus Acidoferrum sp.]|jgi:HlyD family secretion protein|nr:efflux RND transporter periplasmic adaptor subunit [Candidatus Acidoferrum sp.]